MAGKVLLYVFLLCIVMLTTSFVTSLCFLGFLVLQLVYLPIIDCNSFIACFQLIQIFSLGRGCSLIRGHLLCIPDHVHYNKVFLNPSQTHKLEW